MDQPPATNNIPNLDIIPASSGEKTPRRQEEHTLDRCPMAQPQHRIRIGRDPDVPDLDGVVIGASGNDLRADGGGGASPNVVTVSTSKGQDLSLRGDIPVA